MSSFIGNCCVKLNSLVCGSNESSLEKKKRKFKSQQQSVAKNTSSNSRAIHRTEPTAVDSCHQHYVNVAPSHHPARQQNSVSEDFDGRNNNPKRAPALSLESSLNSFDDRRLLHRSSSIASSGVLVKNVILRRNHPSERLGLTLCYGVTSRSTTNIYIQKVDSESIAGHNGELRSGDQIIKINNHRVTSRDEAINLVIGTCRIQLQIVRFTFPNCDFPDVPSTSVTEDDSGVTLACHTDFETGNDRLCQMPAAACRNSRRRCISLSSSALNACSNCRRIESCSSQFQYRRCLSLNDLQPCSFSESRSQQTNFLVRSQSLFGTTTDNEQLILKPLPFSPQQRTCAGEEAHDSFCVGLATLAPSSAKDRRDDSDSGLVCGRSRSNEFHRSRSNQNQLSLKHTRRRYREQRLKEQYQTTDDEPMSELKQGRYWTKEQRKEHLVKARQHRQRAKYFRQASVAPNMDSTTEDFNLLNRIFLRENQQELKQKPFLAYKFGQQSSIERDRLKRVVQQYYFRRIRSQSNTTVSIPSTFDQSSMVVL